jgi:hypothetical protein
VTAGTTALQHDSVYHCSGRYDDAHGEGWIVNRKKV